MQAEGGEGKLKELTQGLKGADFLELDAGARRSLLHIHSSSCPFRDPLPFLPEGS